ncbi:Anti-sigma-K factor RskA [Marisediminitalea aggregata]|uniref:Anti-sigma-K factor RskA n=1 Tax=Marisediminitalea aggregata TaxID=634436 RepID=A0A1M5MHS5_9ALTE|nr:anti-sigma factor [Marisediminitalea aggregata]MAP20863.1 hypothetical protein [Alteromonadaceae bacterium]MAX44430.1 hypothetical protein [Alteromonadaceae bacterium]SHG76489.1 Anti-sigma-K factor RskA [Marisediminitalea aggregata]HBY40132.1 hypothetical protein [Alteromonas sp.]|tara:strand:+ start:1365 stop:2063 length:699 start_codon:yes stop_codon:yes gene_type:complete
MNYAKETLCNALAAEYVLGTLKGKARQRYETLMMENQTIRETTWLWEQHLNGLGEGLKPVQPPPSVWNNIQQKLGWVAQSDNVVTLKPEKSNSKRWQVLAGLSTAAVLLIVLLMPLTQPTVEPNISSVAVVTDQAHQPLWLIELSDNHIFTRATSNLVAQQNKDYELWMVPDDGSAPVSLGLLPKTGDVQLVRPSQLTLAGVSALAVSLEPLGGSPSGSPTEVLYISPLTKV